MLSSLLLAVAIQQQEPPQAVNGVFPHMAVRAPGLGSNSEAGIGALIPWADKLWAVGYVAHIRGDGLGLYEIGSDMSFRKHPASVTGTFANRFVHWNSSSAIIGPHIISEKGVVRTFEELTKHRLAATSAHLSDPMKVYFLTMEGLFFEAHTGTLETKELFDLTKELDWAKGAYLHFKSMHTGQGRVIVTNNTYEEPEAEGKRLAGRLAEWDGKSAWKILERNPFIEVGGNQAASINDYFGNPIFALGWDNSSAILRVLYKGEWTRYRLPVGSQSWLHTWNTEWMRIRQASTERYLMDAFGIFYELPNLVYGGKLWGIKPISSHQRIVPDFVHYNGYFVMASDQTDRAVGQPQSGLYWGNVDDLWSYGKPSGFGGVWTHESVKKGAVSDPYLMNGFDGKSVHFTTPKGTAASFMIEVDPVGDGTWRDYRQVDAADGYSWHTFPQDYSAQWVRIRALSDAVDVTVRFIYS
jgi:hypothetical protein